MYKIVLHSKYNKKCMYHRGKNIFTYQHFLVIKTLFFRTLLFFIHIVENDFDTFFRRNATFFLLFDIKKT